MLRAGCAAGEEADQVGGFTGAAGEGSLGLCGWVLGDWKD